MLDNTPFTQVMMSLVIALTTYLFLTHNKKENKREPIIAAIIAGVATLVVLSLFKSTESNILSSEYNGTQYVLAGGGKTNYEDVLHSLTEK